VDLINLVDMSRINLYYYLRSNHIWSDGKFTEQILWDG